MRSRPPWAARGSPSVVPFVFRLARAPPNLGYGWVLADLWECCRSPSPSTPTGRSGGRPSSTWPSPALATSSSTIARSRLPQLCAAGPKRPRIGGRFRLKRNASRQVSDFVDGGGTIALPVATGKVRHRRQGIGARHHAAGRRAPSGGGPTFRRWATQAGDWVAWLQTLAAQETPRDLGPEGRTWYSADS